MVFTITPLLIIHLLLWIQNRHTATYLRNLHLIRQISESSHWPILSSLTFLAKLSPFSSMPANNEGLFRLPFDNFEGLTMIGLVWRDNCL